MRRILNFLRRIGAHQLVAVYAIICMIIGVYASTQQMDEQATLAAIAQK